MEILIPSKNKVTSIRVTQRTKQLLESCSIRNETYEEIILRLIKLYNDLKYGNN